MKYDAFISYSRSDSAWATKLEKSLGKGKRGRGYEIFLDTKRLTAGDEWDKQLQSGIRQARNLILVWSDNARGSDWVLKETTHFEVDRGDDRQRGLIAVNLQGQNRTLTRFQAIDLTQAYANGADNVSDPLWQQVLDKIEDGIRDQATIPVYTVILTSKLPTLRGIPLDKKPGLAPSYKDTLEAVGIKRDASDDWKTELAKYYGAERSDWKPFGGSTTIVQLLNNLRADIQNRGTPAFHWKPIGDDFWSSDQNLIERETDQLKSELCVVAIDPVSLYDDDVRTRLELLREFLHERSGVLILAPFTMAPATAYFRTLIKGSAFFLFRQFFELTPDGGMKRLPVALCEDDLDVGRLITSMLRQPRESLNKTMLHAAVRP